MIERAENAGELCRGLRSDAVSYLTLAAFCGLMGLGAWFGVDAGAGPLRSLYWLTGLIGSGVGLGLCDSAMPRALRWTGVAGLLLPWFAMLT